MDNSIQKEIDGLIDELKKTGSTLEDPVSKLMVSALLHQAGKIRDEIEAIPARVVSRLSSVFVPRDRIGAVPAMAYACPVLKSRRDMQPHPLVSGTSFNYKLDPKTTMTYMPLFRNVLLPLSSMFQMTPYGLHCNDSYVRVDAGCRGLVWLGLTIPTEIDSVNGLSFLIRGAGGVLPRSVMIDGTDRELEFVTADRMDAIPMMEPFDSQQVDPDNLEVWSVWQRLLSRDEYGRLIYIVDETVDRDLFKCKPYPRMFQQILESNDLDRFPDNMLWFLFDFGEDYEVPEDIEIIPNVVPVVNVGLNNVTLTQSAPIAPLFRNDGSVFFTVVETSLAASQVGFSRNEEEFVIRDFDTSAYNADDLVRDVRNLYNRFVDDYYAFVEFHGLKDGELVRSLRETVNKVGKSVTAPRDNRDRYDSGVYAMRNVRLAGKTTPVRVSYLTTWGCKGNLPGKGALLENRKDAAIEKDVRLVAGAQGGEDRADADMMYELLRYYTLTADRLYTRMDIDAFVRKTLLTEFGADEMKRISHSVEIHGAAGARGLERGLYIEIAFKDRKNYDRAVALSLANNLRNQISDRACISMPVIVSLVNREAK